MSNFPVHLDRGADLLFREGQSGLSSLVAALFFIEVQAKSGQEFQRTRYPSLEIIVSAALGNTLASAGTTPSGGPDPVLFLHNFLRFSFAASFLSALTAMLSKRVLSYYAAQVDMRGSRSVMDRSRHRQQVLNGMEGWCFSFVVGFPVLVLHVALFTLSCGPIKYFIATGRVVTGISIGFALFGLLLFIGQEMSIGLKRRKSYGR